MENNSVSHPSHYNIGNIEVIDIIEDWQLNFSRGNAIKYIARAGHKDPTTEIEDLEKAKWYLEHEIARLKKIVVVRDNHDYTLSKESAFPDEDQLIYATICSDGKPVAGKLKCWE